MLEEQPQARGSVLVRQLPWAVWLLVLAITLAALLLFPPVASDERDLPAYLAYWLSLIWGVACSLIGALITSRRRGNRVGWLLVGLGLVVALTLFASGAAKTEHPAASVFNILSDTLWILSISLLALLVLLFPDGRPLSQRGRPMVWFVALWPPSFLLFGLVFARQDLLADRPPSGPPQIVLAVLLIVTLIGITYSALLRFARSRGTERQQLLAGN